MLAEHTGWIADTNRFKLERPPDWFLTGLTEHDAQLVIIPSRKRRQYLLCRRRQLTAGLGDVAMVDNKHPDTNMCYGYGVLPIAPLQWAKTKTDAGLFTQQNLQSLIETLKVRDVWAHGGGPLTRNPDAVADAVDAADAARETALNRSIWESFYVRHRDAWRSLQARTGQRNQRASDYHGVARILSSQVSPAGQPSSSGGVILTDAH